VPPPPAPPAPETFDPRNAEPGNPGREQARWRTWRPQAAAKCWYRVEFAKTGEMIFLGHLDFQRQLQLALRRSGLPAAHSKGYHPHPILKYGPPLPVGVAGVRECLDIALEHQVPGWTAELNRTLPEGLHFGRDIVIGAQTPPAIDQAVVRFDYRVELPGESDGGPARGEVAAALDAFRASATWPCLRRRPKGDIELDARALVPTGGLGLLPDPTEDGGAVLQLTLLRSETGAILPVNEFLTALLGEALPDARTCAVTRTGYYGRHTDGRWLSPFEEVGESSLRWWLGRHMIG